MNRAAYFAFNSTMLLAALLFAFPFAGADPGEEAGRVWGDVAVEVVEAGSLPRQRWAALGVWRRRGDDVSALATFLGADRLRIDIADGDGYSGHPVRFELERDADGAWSARASAEYWACTIHPAEQYVDVHGSLRVEEWAPGSSDRLRFTYELQVLDAYLYGDRDPHDPRAALGRVRRDVTESGGGRRVRSYSP